VTTGPAGRPLGLYAAADPGTTLLPSGWLVVGRRKEGTRWN
jgi:hypothetical protein